MYLSPPPPPHTALYLLYAKLEEDHGLARHAMAVYDRATKAVTPEEQFEVRATHKYTPPQSLEVLYSLNIVGLLY